MEMPIDNRRDVAALIRTGDHFIGLATRHIGFAQRPKRQS